jgi:hypothetical protein
MSSSPGTSNTVGISVVTVSAADPDVGAGETGGSALCGSVEDPHAATTRTPTTTDVAKVSRRVRTLVMAP